MGKRQIFAPLTQLAAEIWRTAQTAWIVDYVLFIRDRSTIDQSERVCVCVYVSDVAGKA